MPLQQLSDFRIIILSLMDGGGELVFMLLYLFLHFDYTLSLRAELLCFYYPVTDRGLLSIGLNTE